MTDNYAQMAQDFAQVDRYELAALRQTAEAVKRLTEYVMNAPWFDPITMTSRSSIDVLIERDMERSK